MFHFFSPKKLSDSDLFEGMTDYHSHILPGVDDGISTMDKALKVLTIYEELGVKSIFLTPHVMEDYPQNTTSFLTQVFNELKKEYSGNIELKLAAEYMLDGMFKKHLERKDLLTIDKDTILIECSYASTFHNIKNFVKQIQSSGYFAVLAHPERYLCWQKEDYQQMKSMQVKFQTNLFSFMGSYGSSVQQRALQMLDNNDFELIGTDIHSITHLNKILKESTLRKKEFKSIKRLIETSAKN